MVTLPYRYPLDPTGVSPDNLVVGELHDLPNRTVRAFAPLYGGFFAESVIVTDMATGQPLVKNVQYYATEMFEFPTGRYGKEIDGIILITDQTVSSQVSFTYQALGGAYGTNVDAIIQMLNSVELDNRPVAWGDIIDKPDAFEPAFHYHDIGDIYGFEYVVHAVERVRDAILVGDSASHDEIYRYIDAATLALQTQIDNAATEISGHIADHNNPHQTTAAQIGLGQVQNFPFATQAEANAGTGSGYINATTMGIAVNTNAVVPLNTHLSDVNNPHQTTATQIGLGNVSNFLTASDADATTATRTDRFVTPMGVRLGATSIAQALVDAHANLTNNPHGVTAAQVGLGNVSNFAVASEDDAEVNAGSVTDKYMTPVRTMQAVLYWAGSAINAHINNMNNPHNTTATQVGLGNVSNYPVASVGQAQAGSDNASYMTPFLVAQYVAGPLNATNNNVTNLSNALSGLQNQVTNHVNNGNNPHATTAAQVGTYTATQIDAKIAAAITSSTSVTMDVVNVTDGNGFTFTANKRGIIWTTSKTDNSAQPQSSITRNGVTVSANARSGGSGYGRWQHDFVMFQAGDVISYANIFSVLSAPAVLCRYLF